jgi:hypothetical protein
LRSKISRWMYPRMRPPIRTSVSLTSHKFRQWPLVSLFKTSWTELWDYCTSPGQSHRQSSHLFEPAAQDNSVTDIVM